MNQKLFFLLIIITSFFWSSCVHKALKANKFLEKKELAKAKKRIDKAVEKEPKDPATQYMLAKYFSHPVWSYDAVDSAHVYIQLLGEQFPKLDLETIERLAKKGLDSTAIAKQEAIIDSLAFEKALSKNTEEAYNQYLNNYQYLIYKEEAVELRNEVAYKDAIAQNTTQAVSEFFRKYPNAPQAQKARNVFETLYYEKKTQSMTTASYREYLEERPHTEFAAEASLKLLNILSAGADKYDFQEFIGKYGQFQAATKAKSLLDGINYKENSPLWLTHKRDSLYYFYDIEKRQVLPFKFEKALPDSCYFITTPYFLVDEGGQKRTFLKSGQIITDKSVNSIEYLGAGFFVVYDYGQERTLVHYSLNPEMQQEALDFKQIDDFHLAKKEAEGWYLVSTLNEPILKQAVDSIWKEENVYFFKRGKDIAVSSLDDFEKSAKDDRISLSFLYDDYEWLSERHLRLYSNDYETVLDRNAQVIFPLEKAQYNHFDDFWLKEEQGEISLLDSNRNRIFEDKFNDFQYRSGVLALQKDSLWTVYKNGINGFSEFEYDSIRIFNSWLTYAVRDSSSYLLFKSGRKLKLDEGEIFKILKNYNVELSDVSSDIQFVQIVNNKKYFKLYNGFGSKIEEGENLDINVLTPRLIQIHQGKRKSLIDSAGVGIEIEDVEAFGAYYNGLIPILKNKKFGALIVDSLRIIPAHSENKLEVFLKDSLYIFKEDNLLGISDASAQKLIEAGFEAIAYFNDSTAIVQEEGEVGILNIFKDEYLHERIKSWERINFLGKDFFVLRKDAGYGVVDQTGKVIIPFIFNEIQPLKSNGDYYWLAERRLSEINYIVVAYFDRNGKVLFKEGLNFDDFLETACD